MRALGLVFAVALGASPKVASARNRSPVVSGDSLGRARTLDQQGVRAFREGRYRDAVRYFREAIKLGGPSSELWNIARCHLRLDEPEAAATALEEYLQTVDLSSEDRAEATHELDELRRRPSTLTISSSPSGAFVVIDGKAPGPNVVTPVSFDVAQGTHDVRVQKDGFAPFVAQIEARFGHAVILDAELAQEEEPQKASVSLSVQTDAPKEAMFEAGAGIGVLFPVHGGVGAAYVAALVSGSYRVYRADRWAVALGIHGTLTGDSWSNTVRAPVRPAGCGADIPLDENALELSLHGVGSVTYTLSERLSLGGNVGAGVASYFADQAGGDLFEPTCNLSPGLKPSLLWGAQLSYRWLPNLRATFAPVVQMHPAFNGARKTPFDAQGLWWRYGATFGVSLDF